MTVASPKNIQNIINRVMESLPPELSTLTSDFKEHIKFTLEGVLNKLELVTYEEFQVQQAMLLKLREQVSLLETKVQQWEDKEKN